MLVTTKEMFEKSREEGYAIVAPDFWDSNSCKTYVDSGTTYAVCDETISFKFTVEGVETSYPISTLGSCLNFNGQKVLGRAYKSGENEYSARTITCSGDCVTNADGFSYCTKE